MTDSFADPDLAALMATVADDYRARRARGEQPDPEEYAAHYPHAAEQIRGVIAILWRAGAPGLHRPLIGEAFTSGRLGDYRVGREVGRGGTGVVYEAEQISLGRRVALKVLSPRARVNPRLLQRLQNQARAAAGLDHPHIVKVHAVGQEQGVHFIATQFIDGQPLSELIRAMHGVDDASATDGTIRLDSDAFNSSRVKTAARSSFAGRHAADFFQLAAEFGAQAADALEHAHARGIVHRNVKPADLLVDTRGGVWVSDFGLVGSTSADAGGTMSGDDFGTRRYMSPEQVQAGRGVVDHRTDIYSLGATLYELLAGRPVLAIRDDAEIRRAIAIGEPVPLRKVSPSIPVDLETIVFKCLRKKPGDRYSSARDLADDLRRFRRGKPVVARPAL